MLGFPICTDSRTNSLFLLLELVFLHPFAAYVEIDIVTGAATRSLCLESEKKRLVTEGHVMKLLGWENDWSLEPDGILVLNCQPQDLL